MCLKWNSHGGMQADVVFRGLFRPVESHRGFYADRRRPAFFAWRSLTDLYTNPLLRDKKTTC